MLTSASVHDSQVAIPLMTMTSARVFYLYDAAYDAAVIAKQSKALGHVPGMAMNFMRATSSAHSAFASCCPRKLRSINDPDDALYDFRTMVERVNGRLKDEFGRVRGAIKVTI